MYFYREREHIVTLYQGNQGQNNILTDQHHQLILS